MYGGHREDKESPLIVWVGHLPRLEGIRRRQLQGSCHGGLDGVDDGGRSGSGIEEVVGACSLMVLRHPVVLRQADFVKGGVLVVEAVADLVHRRRLVPQMCY